MSVFEGKNIAILGGTGTVGKAIVEYIHEHAIPFERILIYSRDEIKQLEMMEEFPEGPAPSVEYVIGDIRDRERLTEVLLEIDYVIQAAAIKHVVMAEKNPSECYKTNVEGTENVIKACAANNVEQCLLISTDKAVNPLGVYGKSKLAAERLYLDQGRQKPTLFKIIRLGNIIGARGSVFEVFERQKKRGVLQVTHPDATRFCILQDEAARHIIEMFKPWSPSEFTPEMSSFSVLELAKKIAPGCEIEIIGLRPGDKLHEELAEIHSSSSILRWSNNSADGLSKF